jgi:hypothetical protein
MNKTLKTLFWANILKKKKKKKNQKTQKNHWAGFKKKTQVFSNPAL